jgi:hypothetical protein
MSWPGGTCERREEGGGGRREEEGGGRGREEGGGRRREEGGDIMTAGTMTREFSWHMVYIVYTPLRLCVLKSSVGYSEYSECSECSEYIPTFAFAYSSSVGYKSISEVACRNVCPCTTPTPATTSGTRVDASYGTIL